MVDYTAKGQDEKKRSGCLTFIIVVLIILFLLGVGAYFLIPKAVPGILSGGGSLSRLLPEEIRQQTEELDSTLRENIDQIWDSGITPQQVLELLDELDYKKAESIMDDISDRSPTDTSQLIDLVSEHMDLSHLDLNSLKNKYYRDISPEELNKGIADFKKNPIFAQASFRMVKETLKNIIEEESWTYEAEAPAEPEPQSSGSSTTKKKK